MAEENKEVEDKEIINSLTGLFTSLTGQPTANTVTKTINALTTLRSNLRYNLISNDRALLSQSYVEHGILQTLVDQPVDDAFGTGFEIETGQLDADEKEQLMNYLLRSETLKTFKQALIWQRLFGGSALILMTKQNPATPFNLDTIHDFSDIKFKAVDQWELTGGFIGKSDQTATIADITSDYFYYYGNKIHKSRVIPFKGKEAPSYNRPRFRGWGMSELERVVRSLNQYIKNSDVVFELLDEAKIDVYGINGFNSALMTSQGTQKVAERISIANSLKNYQDALVMDKEDTHEQKSMAFAGLGDMLVQIKQGVAGDLKMPITKLFGVSSAGFNSGEDDIENYNSMLESQIRTPSIEPLIQIISIVCKKMFDIVPDDLNISFNALRILSAEQEENVKREKFARVMEAYRAGIISAEEAKEMINAGNLLPAEIEVNDEVFDNFVGGGNEEA